MWGKCSELDDRPGVLHAGISKNGRQFRLDLEILANFTDLSVHWDIHY